MAPVMETTSLQWEQPLPDSVSVGQLLKASAQYETKSDSKPRLKGKSHLHL